MARRRDDFALLKVKTILSRRGRRKKCAMQTACIELSGKRLCVSYGPNQLLLAQQTLIKKFMPMCWSSCNRPCVHSSAQSPPPAPAAFGQWIDNVFDFVVVPLHRSF